MVLPRAQGHSSEVRASFVGRDPPGGLHSMSPARVRRPEAQRTRLRHLMMQSRQRAEDVNDEDVNDVVENAPGH